jgi:hypothetical protein
MKRSNIHKKEEMSMLGREAKFPSKQTLCKAMTKICRNKIERNGETQVERTENRLKKMTTNKQM